MDKLRKMISLAQSHISGFCLSLIFGEVLDDAVGEDVFHF